MPEYFQPFPPQLPKEYLLCLFFCSSDKDHGQEELQISKEIG